jgi:hypothetical protein
MFGYGPYSNHLWRQADGLSVTLNYAEEGMKFSSPKIHSQLSNEGKGIQEFPILYYFNAFVWKVIGQSEGAFRLINIVLLFIGLLYLFRIGKLLQLSQEYALGWMIFAFTSPVLVFYGASFLPNVVAFSMSIIGIYYYLSYFKTNKYEKLLCAFGFMTLAILMRFSLSIFLIPFYLHFGWDQANKIIKNNAWKSGLRNLIIPFSSVVAAILWLVAVKYYNEKHDSWYFLTDLRPIWKLDKLEISNIWSDFKRLVAPEFYQLWIQLLLVLGFIFMLIKRKKSKTLYLFKYYIIFLIVAGTMYFLLWYKNFSVHDYYLVDLLYIPIAIFGMTLYYFKDAQNKVISKLMFILVILLSLSYTISLHRLKYFEKDRIAKYSPLVDQETKDLWDWWHWHYRTVFKAHEDVKPYLRSLGISREDLVICTQDQTPNLTLYLMDQKGFTDLFRSEKSRTERIKEAIEKGAEYLIINTEDIKKELIPSGYVENEIGHFKNIRIYKL